MQDLEKEFKPTSWAIDNKVAIYVMVVFICLAGIMTSPEFLLSATIVASLPPGVTITLSPSISGDSQMPH